MLLIDFLRKHKDKLNWESIFVIKHVPEIFIRENINRVTNWSLIYMNESLSEKFFEDNLHLIDHKFYNFNLSENFIDNHKDKIDWDKFSANASLTLEIVNKYFEYISWERISSNTSITTEIIDAYKNFLNWKVAFHNLGISDQDFDKIKGNLNIKIDRHSEKTFRNSGGSTWNENINPWLAASRSKNLNSRFVDENHDKLIWYDVSMNSSVTVDILDKYAEKVVWGNIIYNKFEKQLELEKNYLKAVKIIEKIILSPYNPVRLKIISNYK